MTEIDLVKEWFRFANNDLIVAKHLFEDLHPKQIEIACYHCQQSAEKAIIACQNAEQNPDDHFARARKMVARTVRTSKQSSGDHFASAGKMVETGKTAQRKRIQNEQ